MNSTYNPCAKTIVSAVFCSFFLIGGAASQVAGPATGVGSREGLPESYHGPASAVAAVVDDKVITTYDLQQRVKLIIISTGTAVTPQILPQIQSQALRDLISEQLKLIEANKFEVKIEDAEIDAELRTMAQRANTSFDDLKRSLDANGVSMDTLRRQVASTILWPRIVHGKYGSRIKVDDSEIVEALKRMHDDATKEQVLVSEICIPVPDPAQAQAYYDGSLQLIEQMRRGVPFAVVAQQFSACPSAATGGDLGWIHAGELPKELDDALQALPTGSVTNPIPSEGAFMILAVRDKRAPVVAGEQSWTLSYAGAPLSMGRNDAILALQKLATADACGGSAPHLDLGPNVGVALIENAKLSDIDERFRSAVEDLSRGDLSGVVEADDALHIVYVCDKDEGLGLPSRDAITDSIYGRKLNQIAQQYLRDIERKTMVDIRLKQQAPPNG
ncbi:MAG: peptidylprolyl isomerase [Parvularculaceae bacterium]